MGESGKADIMSMGEKRAASGNICLCFNRDLDIVYPLRGLDLGTVAELIKWKLNKIEYIFTSGTRQPYAKSSNVCR